MAGNIELVCFSLFFSGTDQASFRQSLDLQIHCKEMSGEFGLGALVSEDCCLALWLLCIQAYREVLRFKRFF